MVAGGLSTRASEGEAELLFAALADLIEGFDPQVLEQVPARKCTLWS